LYAWAVKRKFAFPNCRHFLAKVVDFRLKYCILKEKAKNNVTGKNIAQDPPKNPKTGGRSDHELIKTSPEN
jgi:hypothetical protein